MRSQTPKTLARLLITCQDQPGIVSKVSGFLYQHHANITALDQYSTDPKGGTFFMRVEFQTPHLDLTENALKTTFQKEIAQAYQMDWEVHFVAQRKKMAVFVSKYDHALLEILWRWQKGELAIDIPLVISNHPDLKAAVSGFGLPFFHVPIEKENKVKGEQAALELVKGQVDGIILARYMQILSKDFIDHFPNRIINIHHSFLPAFRGANPYRQAFEKGVKLIGATAHYVTEELDMGPIIAQDVLPVSHRFNTHQLQELGQDIERNVLANAVKAHCEDRILVHMNKTIVF